MSIDTIAVVIAIILGAIIVHQGVICMSTNNSAALTALAASVAAVGEGVASIGREVGETGEAIRNHLTGEGGPNTSAILAAVDTLNAAASKLSSSAAELDTLQGTLAAPAAGEEQEQEQEEQQGEQQQEV